MSISVYRNVTHWSRETAKDGAVTWRGTLECGHEIRCPDPDSFGALLGLSTSHSCDECEAIATAALTAGRTG